MRTDSTSNLSISRIISGREDLLLEQRIFNTAASVLFILSIVVAIISLTTDSNPWMAGALSVISLVFLVIVLSTRYQKGFYISSRIFVLFTLVFNDIAWCWSVALTPAANYFFVLIVIVDLTILKVKDHFGFMLIVVSNLFLMDYLAYSYPRIFINHHELIDNITFPYRGHGRLASLVVLISVILFFFKKNYERERKLAIERSRQLMNINASLDNRNQHLESMARMVSHNLRSPVAGLKMIIQLYDKVDAPEKREELVSNMKEGSTVLFDMVEDLSQAMLDYRELIKEQEKLSLEKTLDTVTRQLSQQIRESGASIHHNFSTYPTVNYSRHFLESIFLNMISNAIKYQREGVAPLIIINSYLENDKVMLSFSDNGIGIDLKEHGEKVFQMYKTFHNRNDVDSRGIGLFMTKNQVEMMGGKIDLKSTPGKGTTFFLELYRL